MGHTHQINAGVQEKDKNISRSSWHHLNNPKLFSSAKKFKGGVDEGQ